MAGGDNFTRFPSLAKSIVRIKNQMRLGLGRISRMAFVAVVHKDRTDLLLEKIDPLFRRTGVRQLGCKLRRTGLYFRLSDGCSANQHDQERCAMDSAKQRHSVIPPERQY